MDGLAFLSATEQAELIRRGEVTSGELVETYLQRIERLDPKLNAYVTVCADEARAAAENSLLAEFEFSQFEPGKRGGRAVRFRMAVPVVFRLDNS